LLCNVEIRHLINCMWIPISHHQIIICLSWTVSKIQRDARQKSQNFPTLRVKYRACRYPSFLSDHYTITKFGKDIWANNDWLTTLFSSHCFLSLLRMTALNMLRLGVKFGVFAPHFCWGGHHHEIDIPVALHLGLKPRHVEKFRACRFWRMSEIVSWKRFLKNMRRLERSRLLCKARACDRNKDNRTGASYCCSLCFVPFVFLVFDTCYIFDTINRLFYQYLRAALLCWPRLAVSVM